LKEAGWRRRDIADALDVREETVSRWVARARKGGISALEAHPASGRPSRLTDEQRLLIPELLWHGAEAHGFRGDVWTTARISRVIEEEFGVRYHKSHVGRLLHGLGWTPQAPVRRASQRDEATISEWRRIAWPRLLQRAKRERRTPVFADESGFYLLPGLVKTYSPRGETPIICHKQTRAHLCVIGAFSTDGKVFTLVRQESLNGLHVVEFMIHLLRVAGDRLLIIWDGSPIHRRAEVKEFVAATGGRIWLEALPPYAPDLNPWDEGGWNHLKTFELRNFVSRDLEELHEQPHLAVARLRQKPQLILAFF
jgi:transposase